MRNNNQSWKRMIALVLVICMSMSLNQNVNAAQVQETSDSTSNMQGEDLSGTDAQDVASTEEARLLMLDVKDSLGNSLMDFDNTKTEYEILVNYDVDKVTMEAEASDESVVIDETQIGEKTLEIGENEFIVCLNDKETEYKIMITRESAKSDTTSIDMEKEVSEPEESGNEITIQPFAMTRADSKIVIETETNSSQSQVTVLVKGLYPNDNVQNVRIPVWGNTGGQNDIKWYSAEKVSSGIWKATVDIASHKESGWYSVHVYAQINGGASKLVAGTPTSFYIDPIPAQSVQIVDLDEAAGTFTVKLSGNAAPASITSMRVPVWSAVNGQDDIIWYTAKESGGSWYVTVDVMRHNYDLGKYNIHVYAYDSRGISNIVGASSATLNHMAKEKLDISLNADETKATITLQNAKYNSSTSVSFPVWGNVNGQNDLKWYMAKQISPGTWQAVVNISDHKESGLYSVHAYTVVNGKPQSLAAHNSFNITEIKAGSIAVVEQDHAAGTFKIKIAGITTPASVTEVLVPVWSEINGQDDLIWYKATKSGDAWYANVNIADHNYDLGRYAIHVYVQDSRGIKKLVGVTNTTITEAKAESLSYVVNSNQTQVTITLDNVRERNLKSVRFAVWGEENGQNDLKWYTATKSKSGCYTYTMNISTHKESGKYNIHAYKETNSGSKSISRASQFTIDRIGNAAMEVLDNNGSGVFRVKISNISTPASITKVMVPVWSAVNGQDDLIWYEAEKSGNAWYISVDSMNHKFDTGTYNIHVYATDSRGITNIVAGTTTTVKQTVEEVLAVQRNSTQTQVTIALKNVRASDVKNVVFAVWGEKDGQNDLRWYTANNIGNGNYTLTINISNHKEAGTYNVHAYKKNAAGTMKISGGVQFSISNIGAAKVEIVEKNEEYGTYKVKVSNISSPAAITQVLIPTWSSVNGQDDIKWYTALKSGDAWYATIEAYNHGYATGTYISHAYVTDARGIQAIVGSASTNVNATKKLTSVYTVAVIKTFACPVYSKADTTSPLDTQALYNQKVQILSRSGSFLRVTVPDGYTGYIEEKNVTYSLDSLYGEKTYCVIKTSANITDSNGSVICQAPMCTELYGTSYNQNQIQITLPSGTKGFIQKSDVKTYTNGTISFTSGQAIADTAQMFMGTKYLWGGTSVNGIDCSGLTYICYRLNGITLPRDAEPQSKTGTKISRANIQVGDLVFFSSTTSKVGVSHTGIYIGNGNFIHSSSGKGCLTISSLSETYYAARLVSINRYY